MAINAYTGLMGSGKSYEVVENVILPALLSGRRVVTNVANLQMPEIKTYLVEKFDCDYEKLGWIVQIQNDDVTRKDFFPIEVKAGETAPESIVKPGDLVVIDECWRWWAAGMKILPEHMTFFRMHRHFVDPDTKVTCDMVLVVQDIGDLDRKLKVVVENTYRMTKLKALGTSNRYRVDVYQGHKVTPRGSNKLREIQRAYNPEIFKLYQSYSQGGEGGGKEKAIDKRATIWGGPLFTIVLPLLFIASAFALWRLNLFFHPEQKTAAKAKPTTGGSGASGAPPSASSSTSAPSESEWHVVGDYQANGNRYVMLSRGGAVRTLINPKQFFFDGLRAYGSLDGQTLTNYTGSDGLKNMLGGEKK